jgi:hypothetical protein
VCARARARRGAYRALMGQPEGKSHLKDLGVDGRIILKSIFKTLDRGLDWIDVALGNFLSSRGLSSCELFSY